MLRGRSIRRSAVVFSLGFFALIAQTLLFRGFFAVYEGNELGLACFFSSWLLWVALGGGAACLLKRRIALNNGFEFLTLLYIPAFLLQLKVISASRALAGVSTYELFPFARMFPVSFIANAPVSFLIGLLFSLACEWMSGLGGIPVARVYIVETIGAFVGGILVTMALAFGMSSETIFLYAGLVVCAAALVCSTASRRVWASLPAAGIVLILLLGGDRALTRANDVRAWQRLLPAETYEGSFTTPQAKYLYGSYNGQFNVMAWQSVVDSIPGTESASEVIAVHLSQNPGAETFLAVGPGTYSICRRLLDVSQVKCVAWVDTDPDYPAQLLKILPEDMRSTDSRLAVSGLDIREHLAQSTQQSDVVILNLPASTTLALNRYFTREFFELVRANMAPSGVVGVRVQGGENFMGDELINLGASVYHTLAQTYSQVVIKPGAETWLLASNGGDLIEVPGILRERFLSINGADSIYPSEGLLSLYPVDRIEYQRTQYERASEAVPERLLVNTDKSPKALLHALLYVAKEMGGSDAVTGFIHFFASYGVWIALLPVFIYLLLRWVYVFKSGHANGRGVRVFDVYFLVGSSGAVGMGLSIVLMFIYQSAYGSIFLHIGLISAIFMAGLAAGSISVERTIVRRPEMWSRLLAGGVLLHICLMVLIAFLSSVPSRMTLAVLFCMSGLLGGVYVPLAAAALREKGREDRYAGAMIELSDHLGGAIGGLAAGLLLLPVLGGQLSLVVVAALIGVNVIFLLSSRRDVSPERLTLFDRRVRAAGYFICGLALFLLLVSAGFRATRVENLGVLLRSSALAMGGKDLSEESSRISRGDSVTVYTERDESGALSFRYFHTGGLVRDVIGFAGPVVLAVKTDVRGVLKDFEIIRSNETASYVDTLREWRRQLRGRNIFEPEPFAGVDAYSGATLTSEAIMRTLSSAGSAFSTEVLKNGRAEGGEATRFVLPDVRVFVLILFAGIALYLRRNPSRMARRGMLAAVVLVAGFYLNMQYSPVQVFSLLTLRLPSPGMNVAFWLILLLPVFVLLFGNLYCGYLCPFGALQELLGDLLPDRFRIPPDKEVWKYGKLIKYLILLGMGLLFVSTLDHGILNADPLVTFFGKSPERPILILSVAVLVLSVVFPRFWCRNICPTGAFLSLLNGAHLLRRLIPPVTHKLCVYGVRRTGEFDCLCCDRCRKVHAIELRRRQQAGTERQRTVNTVFIACVLIVTVIVAHLILDAHREGASLGNARTELRGGGEPRDVDMSRLMRMIEEGQLSDHEAMHYHSSE
ncbi:MAG: 4Fe-4S binding protein [Verrucomicrobia bacterium]|nr:4Fe-4S binding protein [Verrucomicrobiota bacterium]